MTMKKKDLSDLAVRIMSALIMFGMILFTLTAVSAIERDSRAGGLQRAENAVRSAVMACYAGEGVYPPSLEYLEENYGLSIDSRVYTVHYNAFARNIMPDITVTLNS